MIDYAGQLKTDRDVAASHRGFFDITPELIADLMMLPQGTSVRGAFWNPETNTVRVVVENEELPLIEDGKPTTRLAPEYRTIDGKAEFHSWGVRDY